MKQKAVYKIAAISGILIGGSMGYIMFYKLLNTGKYNTNTIKLMLSVILCLTVVISLKFANAIFDGFFDDKKEEK